MERQPALPIAAALCVDQDALDRLGGVLRHLLVGLVEQAVTVRLLSSDPRVTMLTLGPVKTHVHGRLVWPYFGRRLQTILDSLAPNPPTIVHAFSHTSYRAGMAVAEALDAELILHVTSLADCDAIVDLSATGASRYITVTQPLQLVLEEQLRLPAERVHLIRPGVRVSPQVAGFARPQHVATLLCATPLHRGHHVDQLIDAVHRLTRRDHAMMLFLLRGGPQETGLRRLIRDRRLSSRVTLAQPTSEIDTVMGSADLLISPAGDTSFWEDIIQAMAAGLAVVAVRSPIYDFLRRDETAVVCDHPTGDELATAIERLLEDRAFGQRLAKAGMEYVRTHHSVSSMADQTVAVYRELALSRATFPLGEKA